MINDTKLIDLYKKRNKMILENKNTDAINLKILSLEHNYIDVIFEDGDGGGVASAGGYSGGVAYADCSNVTGMGPVTSGQPSIIPGILNSPQFGDTGGVAGSDVATTLQETPYQKKYNKKKKKKKEGYENSKILSYSDFQKNTMNQLTKTTEGYEIDNLVLVEYWYNHMITVVKVLEKKGNKYLITHNIPESKIQNAPDEWVKSSDIIDEYAVNENKIYSNSFVLKRFKDI